MLNYGYAPCPVNACHGFHSPPPLNEDRSKLSISITNVAQELIVSGNIRFVQIFIYSLERGASNDSGVVENRDFCAFNCYIFGNFRNKPKIIT